MTLVYKIIDQYGIEVGEHSEHIEKEKVKKIYGPILDRTIKNLFNDGVDKVMIFNGGRIRTIICKKVLSKSTLDNISTSSNSYTTTS